MKIPPRITSGEELPLHKIGAINFQKLIRDLLQFEPQSKNSELFGVNGQAQLGIDVRVIMSDGKLHLAQCKCYESFTSTNVAKASNEFLKYWDRWESKNVSRFILCVSADLSDRKIHNQVSNEVSRFAKLGVDFETWSRAQIVNKMRDHRGIMASYFDSAEDWIRIVCGPDATATEVATAGAEHELAMMNRLMRVGRWRDCQRWFDELTADASRWDPVSPEIRSSINLFGARLAIQNNDLDLANRRLAVAESHADSEAKARVRALILLGKSEYDNALDQLDGFRDRRTKNLAALIYFSKGDYVRSMQNLNPSAASTDPDYETHQTKALVSLVQGNSDVALSEINEAKTLEPESETVRFTDARIAYFLGVCGGVDHTKVATPIPIARGLVRKDRESAERFRQSALDFEALSSNYDIRSPRWEYLTGWALASRLNDFARPEDGKAYAQHLLSQHPEHMFVVLWCFADRVTVDLKRYKTILEAKLSDGTISGSEAVSLLDLELQSDNNIGVDRVQYVRQYVSESHDLYRWASLYVEALVQVGQFDEARKFVATYEFDHKQELGRFFTLRTASEEEALKIYGDLSIQGEVSGLLAFADGSARAGNWKDLDQIGSDLLAKIPTPESLALAAISAYNIGDPAKALAVITNYGTTWSGGTLSPQLLKITAAAKRALGNLPEACADLSLAIGKTGTISDRLKLLQYLVEMGDTKAAAVLARSFVEEPKMTAWDCLIVSNFVKAEDFNLARSLCERAITAGVADDDVVRALSLAYDLRLDDKTEPLILRLSSLAASGHPSVRAIPVAELPNLLRDQQQQGVEIAKMYASGIIPVHLICEQSNVPLSNLYHVLLESNEKKSDESGHQPLFARHETRVSIGKPILPTDAIPYLDVTAILLLWHFGLLGTVEKSFTTLRVSKYLPQILYNMMAEAGVTQPKRTDARRLILRAIQTGELSIGDKASPTLRSVTFEGDVQNGVLSFRDIADALHDRHEISNAAYVQALEFKSSLPTGATLNSTAALEIDASVFMVLAEIGILNDVSRLYDTRITADDSRYVSEGVAEDERRSEHRSWLAELGSHLSQSIRDGHCVLTHEPEVDVTGDDQIGGVMLSLNSAIRFKLTGKDYLWIDDRGVNRFTNREGAPIVTFLEILNTLVARKDISALDFYEIVNRMRRSDIRYIPVTADELMYWMSQAPVGPTGELVEIRPLMSIKHYIERSIRESSGQANWFSGSSLQTVGEIVEQLSKDPDSPANIARSRWLRENIYNSVRHLIMG